VNFVYPGGTREQDSQEIAALTVGIESNIDIKKGEQILVDYGQRFWHATDAEEDEIGTV